jgi:hypothetical protein
VIAHLQRAKLWIPTTLLQMLKGEELLAKVKELGQAPRDQIAIACGYTRKDGKPAFTAFFEALNEAHGIALPPASTARKPRAGKPLSWNVAVSKTGVIPVSAGYSSLLGLESGDRVDIAHDAATGTLTLRKAAAEPVACAAPVVVTEAPTVVAAAERELVAAGERAPL